MSPQQSNSVPVMETVLAAAHLVRSAIYTMDDLVEHSQKFFSSDPVNITLVFMCGVHNLTKNLMYKIFAHKGETENVIIDMLHQEIQFEAAQIFGFST